MRKALLVVALLAVAGPASAQRKNVYGTAGCGLGSMAFGDQKGAIQIVAATLNGTFGSQTFGITTGTSNCGESAVGLSGTKTFIEGNREALAKDAARGSGDTVTALSKLAGCKDAGAVGATLQRRFGELFPAAAPAEDVSQGVISALKADKALACNSLS